MLSIGYMPFGPVVDQSAPAPQLVTVALLNDLTKLAKSLTPAARFRRLRRDTQAEQAGLGSVGDHLLGQEAALPMARLRRPEVVRRDPEALDAHEHPSRKVDVA